MCVFSQFLIAHCLVNWSLDLNFCPGIFPDKPSCSLSFKVYKLSNSVSVLKTLIAICEKYRTASSYPSHRLMLKALHYEAYVSWEMRKIRANLLVQLKQQLLNGKVPIFVIEYCSLWKRTWDLWTNRDLSAVWYSTDLISVRQISAVKKRLTSSYSYANRLEGINAFYCSFINETSKQYDTDPMVKMPDEEICSFHLVSLRL